MFQGMTIHTLARYCRHRPIHRPNPYESLSQVFERGVFVDWDKWEFTNLRLDNLGRLPEPIL